MIALRKITFLVLAFFITATFAQQSYYNDVNLSLEGIALKNELATKITNTHTNILSYSEAREAIKIVDLVPGQGNNVLLVYGFAPQLCPASPSNDNEHRRRDKSDFDNGGNDPCLWNREHTYPRSLGTPDLGTSGPGADAHMLRACDKKRNAERANKFFRDGTGNSHTVNSIYWYPGDEWKGDMARIIMYMYLRYGSQCLPINVGFGESVANDSNMIDLFLEWNAEDPVSEYEEYRNTYMEHTSNMYGQGNRNPFIDNPYLATRIWGGDPAEDIWGIYIGTEEFALDSNFIIYPNPCVNSLFIKKHKDFQISSISIKTINGVSLQSFDMIQSEMILLESIQNGVYILQINTTEGEQFAKKLVVNKNMTQQF